MRIQALVAALLSRPRSRPLPGLPLLLALLFAGVLASPARATPAFYAIDSGFVTLTASVGGVEIAGPVTADLDGIQVTIDEDAMELVSIVLRAPGPIALDLSPAYAGYTSATLVNLTLSGSAGLLAPVASTPDAVEYFFLLDPLVVEAALSAEGAGPPLVEVPISDGAPASGSLFVASSLDQLSLSGITIAQFLPEGIDGPPIVVKADFVASGVLIPEPGAALLFVVGLATLAARRPRGGVS